MAINEKSKLIFDTHVLLVKTWKQKQIKKKKWPTVDLYFTESTRERCRKYAKKSENRTNTSFKASQIHRGIKYSR